MGPRSTDIRQKINHTIAQFLTTDPSQNYTEHIDLAWQSLEKLQGLGYGFTLNSLGRNNLKVRIVKWASNGYTITSTGEYIVNVMDSPPALAICRAVSEAIMYDKIPLDE